MASETPETRADDYLLNLAQAFSELYHHHLHTENQQIFPLVEQQFSNGELDGMASGISLDSPAREVRYFSCSTARLRITTPDCA